MKLVEGLEEARTALLDGRTIDLESVPPHVQRRTEDAFGGPLSPARVVERIVGDVRIRGDEAVRDYERRLGGSGAESSEVGRGSIEQAAELVPREIVDALEVAAGRIRKFHETSMPRPWEDDDEGYGEVFNPVERVGAYVPGGTAKFPSTVLMTVVPAKVAGVDEVVVATPGGEDGIPDPMVLAAARIARADRVFAISGAQAIAAMAYGTETVPRVDLVCGPGNVFVTLAKKQVFGDVGVDGLYGPTETALIADETANATLCVADLIAQAEHDELATPVLITTSALLAQTVEKEIVARAERLDRGSIAREAIENRGCIAVVDDLDQGFTLANEFAPEHLSLMVRDPRSHVDSVRNAGAIFLGEFSHEVLGDYVAGPSHVMPTGGTARFNSGINVRTFLKSTPVVGLEQAASVELGRVASILGRAEGFTGHAEAAEIRDEFTSGEE